VKVLALFMCIMLVACSSAPTYNINAKDFWFSLRLVDEMPEYWIHGIAEWDNIQCRVTLVRQEYPRCLQHEVRHCLEGGWHGNYYNSDDCFY